jgi:ubiquinone/menaquinone biosynthesis C-methylase UbiE
MRDLLTGYRTTQMIIVAAKAGVADALAKGPRSAAELAAAANVDAQALYRVLRGLATFGIFKETADGRFELTPLAEHLRSDAPGSLNSVALIYSEPWWWNAWGHMFDAVKTGKTAFNTVHGEDMFDFLNRHPEAAARFNAHMVSVTDAEARAIVAAYDFSKAKRLIDVAGGHGALLCEILKAHCGVSGALFDRAAVVAGAPPRFQQAGVADRCSFVAGDFFASVPSGFDAYVLKSIIHDWDDERALKILRNCRRAMTDDAKLLLVEHIIPLNNEPTVGKIWDITMLVITGGLERTQAEHEQLLRTAGFRINAIAPTASGTSVIEALPV